MFRKSQADFSSIANAINFLENPEMAWGFYAHRLELYRATVPHDGFSILKKWSEKKLYGYSIYTSNVDGQFQKAGFSPDSICECHGSIHHLQCADYDCNKSLWSADAFNPIIDKDKCLLINSAPVCELCKNIARPNILMFDDSDWLPARTNAQLNKQRLWLASVERPVVIELGAGTHIPSVRDFSGSIIRKHNGRLIRINPREFSVDSELDVGLACGALAGLTAIDRQLQIQ